MTGLSRITVLLLFLLISAAFLSGEELILTVDKAVEMAVSGNLQLKQAQINLNTKERAKKNRYNTLIPGMSASVALNGFNEMFTDKGLAPPAITDPGAIGLTTGINFSWPLNISYLSTSKQLIADYEAGLIDYEKAKKELEKNVRKQFYYLLASQENIRIEQANLDLAVKRLAQAKSNFENGIVPELEVLQSEVTVANLLPKYNSVKANYENQLLSFKFFLGMSRDTQIKLEGALDTRLYSFNAEDLINAYISRRLDIKLINKNIQILEYTKKSAGRGMNTPTLNLGYSYSLSGTNSDTDRTAFPPASIDPWSDWNDKGALSISLSWKFDGLIPGSKTDLQLKEIQDKINNLDISRQMAFEQAGIEITNLVNNLDTAKKTIEANTSTVKMAKKSYELTEEAYKAGARELLDVEDAQTKYLQATQQLLLAKYNYLAGLLDLEYALNTPIEEVKGNKN